MHYSTGQTRVMKPLRGRAGAPESTIPPGPVRGACSAGPVVRMDLGQSVSAGGSKGR